MQYNLLTYIGRFQPFHVGHKAVVDYALGRAERVALVIGSSGSARTPKNPWTAEERIQMIRACFTPEEQKRLVFIPQRDYPYNHDKWLSSVTASVGGVAYSGFQANPYSIGLIGLDKDHTSFYLKHFPQWTSVEFKPEEIINATDIRAAFFDEDNDMSGVNQYLPLEVSQWLTKWHYSHAKLYHEIADENAFLSKYRKQFDSAPYPPIFMTVDAVVTQAAHVLMVSRKEKPGQGLLALPGGFVNQTEKLKDAMIRELREETQLKVPEAVLRGSIVNQRTFDEPGRSLRGRTITAAYHIRLDEKALPKVKGGDDASRARWIPLAELRQDQCFEDHFSIIESLVGL